MTFSSFSLQAVVTVLGAVAFVINAIPARSKTLHLVGRIEKIADQKVIIASSRERITISVPDSARIFLNDDAVSFDKIAPGRTARITFTKSKGALVATDIDVFPVFEEQPPA